MAKASDLLRSVKENLDALNKLMEGGSVSKTDRESFSNIIDQFNKFEKDMNSEPGSAKSESRAKEIRPLDAGSDSERLMI